MEKEQDYHVTSDVKKETYVRYRDYLRSKGIAVAGHASTIRDVNSKIMQRAIEIMLDEGDFENILKEKGKL